MNIVEKVVSAGLCTGCGLCEAVSSKDTIQMRISNIGYLRPVILKEISENAQREIEACCPGVQISYSQSMKGYHRNWGALESVKVGYASDQLVRKLGSSGGVLSAISIFLIESGAVDFVLQIAFSKTSPIENEIQISRSKEDVMRAAGSRYGPSSPLRRIKELLTTGEKFAFIGKPCDVAALRAYLNLHPQYKVQVPYIFSFMCAGIPSVYGTHEVLDVMGVDKTLLSSFRYRGDGWPGMARATQADGRVFTMDYHKSWGSILGKHLQFRCKICADGTGEFADLVCADAWYGKDGYPDFTEQDGRSLILARTGMGVAVLANAIRCNSIHADELPVAEIASMQPYQLSRKQLVLARVIGAYLAKGRTIKYRGLRLIETSAQAGFLDLLRNLWGTFRRAKGEQLSSNKND